MRVSERVRVGESVRDSECVSVSDPSQREGERVILSERASE